MAITIHLYYVYEINDVFIYFIYYSLNVTTTKHSFCFVQNNLFCLLRSPFSNK